MLSDSTLKNFLYRFPGVKPFDTGQKDLFFGRSEETLSLLDLIQARQITVLFGRSGFGKSSLINAGIIPLLNEERRYSHINVRFTKYLNESNTGFKPDETLRELLRRLLKSRTCDELAEVTNSEETFWFLVKAIQWEQKINEIVIFFDQFEELFSYPKQDIENFSCQLADVLYSPVPIRYRQHIGNLKREGRIDDEFYAFLNEKPNIKVVLSVRSDRLSLLSSLSTRHPSILSNCFELKALSLKQARDAIVEPALLSGNYISKPFKFRDDAVQFILSELADPVVSTIQTHILQIICRYIEDKLVVLQEKDVIEKSDLNDIKSIFQKYYEETISIFPDKEQVVIQELIEEKLITNRQRNSLSGTFIQSEFGVNEDILGLLENSSIIRKERDASGRWLYEVSHDTLVEPILLYSQRRIEKKEKERQLIVERQIEEERKRVRKLKRANLLVSVALFAATIASITAFINYRSSREAEKSAKKALGLRTVALLNLNYQKANELLIQGNQYYEYEEYELARMTYKEAIKQLGYTVETRVVPARIDDLIEELYQKLSENIKKTEGILKEKVE